MIRLVKTPKTGCNSAEGIRVYETLKAYGNYALFWHQNGGEAVISMLEKDMIISGEPTDYEELSAFIRLISPNSIFANSKTLKGLNLFENSLKVSVLMRKGKCYSTEISSELSSKDVYDMLKKGDFLLPEYDYFATDYCLRRNKGRLSYFAMSDKALAMCIGKRNVLINGMISLKPGNGSKCLEGLLNRAKPQKAFVCATKDVEGFYIKNGFEKIYEAGYWRK